MVYNAMSTSPSCPPGHSISPYAPPVGAEFDQWKAMVLAHMDERRDQYREKFSMRHPRVSRCYRSTRFAILDLFAWGFRPFGTILWRLYRLRFIISGNGSDTRAVSAKDRVMILPELFEMVVRSTSAETQIRTAWNVSQTWRQTIRHILRAPNIVSFQDTGASTAVAFGDILQSNEFDSLLKPSAEELNGFFQSVSILRQNYDDCRVQRSEDPQQIRQLGRNVWLKTQRS
jgi:hypothetical protein